MIDKNDKQMRLPGFDKLEPVDDSNWETLDEPPKYEDLVSSSDKVDKKNNQVKPEANLLDVPSLAVQQNALPASLKASAEASIDLRNVQRRLASMLTKEDYIAIIASCRPEVLPELMNSITNGIATADNLMIKTMQEASKNSTTNKLLEYMVQQQQQANQTEIIEQKDKYYDASIDKIKLAIYHKLDKENYKHKKTAKDYIDSKDTEPIDIEYTINKEINEDEQSK